MAVNEVVKSRIRGCVSFLALLAASGCGIDEHHPGVASSGNSNSGGSVSDGNGGSETDAAGSGGKTSGGSELPCDPVAPAGAAVGTEFESCAADEQCAFRNGNYACVSRTKPGKLGASCGTDSDCTTSLGCIDGFCRNRCNFDDSTCSQGEVCAHPADYRAGQVGYCATLCSLKGPIECADGQRCDFGVDKVPICHEESGTGEAYTPCTDNGDCIRSLACQQIGTTDGTNPIRYCLPWATSAGDCGDNESLVKRSDAPGYAGKTWGFCYASCDPLNPASAEGFRACGGGEVCEMIADENRTLSLSRCAKPGALKLNEWCDVDTCGSGLDCRLVCVQYCKVGHLEGCPALETCDPFVNIRKVNTTEYGFCRAASCDPVLQTPCAVGEHCVLAHDYAVCTPDVGTRKAGDQCKAHSDCTKDTDCFWDDFDQGICQHVCRIGTTECGSDVACTATNPQTVVEDVEYGFCPAPSCNPFQPSMGSPFVPCTGGLTCRFQHPTYAHCSADAGNVDVGGVCKKASECRNGQVCTFFNGVGACRVACRIAAGASSNPDCPASATGCYAFTPSQVMEGVEVGYCE